jgi:ABC-2 type transport system ATP-binding protein
VSWRDAGGERCERDTDDPTAMLHELTSSAMARGERLHELTVTRPTLEDVYLELTETAA